MRHFFCLLSMAIVLAYRCTPAYGQEEFPTTNELKKLSVEELMNIEVTTVSRVPEKLSEVASAVQVITRDDILRSGATNLPEALRLASNLQVAQVHSHGWLITARGFKSSFSNKLLVMINGRTVYSPLFAGVFWDAQQVLLEDVDRIEVISGPGGITWGANAVNGVINIITRKAADAKGVYASYGRGTFLRDQAGLRYAGTVGEKLSYRIYGLHSHRSPSDSANGADHDDEWRITQAGFHIDYAASAETTLSFRGNAYIGETERRAEFSTMDGQNFLGRLTHAFSERSVLTVQTYFDRTWRHDLAGGLDDELFTWDIDVQHSLRINRMHMLVWGVGYRFMDDKTRNYTDFFGLYPDNRTMDLFSAFVLDEIRFSEKIRASIGSKVQHNVFTGFEVQPGVKLAWHPHSRHMLWASAARAVRAPSRIDRDYHIPAFPVPPTQPSVAGGPNFQSEVVDAFEVGYRAQLFNAWSLSLATFYNKYDDLFSVELQPNSQQYQIENGVRGDSYGVEFLAGMSVTSWWRVRAGHTYFYKRLENKPGNEAAPIALTNLGTDHKNQSLVQSIMNPWKKLQFDVTARRVGRLPVGQFTPAVSPYFAFDVRLAWVHKEFEFALIGQNLPDVRHNEWGLFHIPRNYFAKLTWRH